MNNRIALAAGLVAVVLGAACESNDTTGPSDSSPPTVSLFVPDEPGQPLRPAEGRSPLTWAMHDAFPTDIDFENGFTCFEDVGAFFGDPVFTDAIFLEGPGGGGCLNAAGFPPHSPIGLVGAVSGPEIGIDFADPKDEVGGRVTSFTPATLSCFDGPGGTGALLGMQAQAAGNCCGLGVPNETLRVAAAGIRSCVWAGPTGSFSVDDVFFSPSDAKFTCPGLADALREAIDGTILPPITKVILKSLIGRIEGGDPSGVALATFVIDLLEAIDVISVETEADFLALLDLCLAGGG